MAANSLLAGAAQILCFIAYRGAKGATSSSIARSLKTNPVFVRRILKDLERQGLVDIRPGRHGGVGLRRAPNDITLGDIHRAVGGGGLFALRAQGNRRCVVNESLKGLLPPLFAAASEAAAESLGRTKLSALLENIA